MPKPALLPHNVSETSNPAAVGWQRVDDDSTHVQVAWPRGTRSLLFAMKGAATGTWTTTITLDSTRWAHDGTLAGARAAALDFLSDSPR
jgi:hypothetical protein